MQGSRRNLNSSSTPPSPPSGSDEEEALKSPVEDEGRGRKKVRTEGPDVVDAEAVVSGRS